MILIRLKGVLTPAEEKLAAEKDGAQLIKQVRMRLIESSRTLLEQIIMADFLDRQMGEHAGAVETFLAGDTITVRATNCLSPGERNLVQNEQDWHLLREFKSQQFEHVKLQLKEQLEQITDCEVLNIVSVVGQDGMRFEVVTLSKNFEN